MINDFHFLLIPLDFLDHKRVSPLHLTRASAQVDSMWESIHALRCAFLYHQGTQNKRIKQPQLCTLAFPACSSGNSLLYFSGSRSSEAVSIESSCSTQYNATFANAV